MTDCPVCFQKINKINKLIKCIHCNYNSCYTCSKKYILNDPNNARCMNEKCKKEWNRDFLQNSFSDNFLKKEYKEHRENLLFDKQISMMPETQIEAEKRIKINDLTNKISELKKEHKKIKKDIDKLDNERWRLKRINKKKQEPIKVLFYGHCTEENCRGFLNNNFKCGICKTQHCTKCRKKETMYHKCNKEDIKSVKLIDKDSKPCPKCKAFIYKIEGCSSMWCTMCHVAFDWRTGEPITKGPFHNPHYQEWRMTHSNNEIVQNNYCRELRIENINMINLLKGYTDRETSKFFHFLLGFVVHCEHEELEKYEVDIQNYEIGDYLELRIQYLLNEISETEFKRKLQYNEKKVHKKNEIYLIIDMFVNSAKDIYEETFRVGRNLKGDVGENRINQGKKMLKDLIIYTNNSFANLEYLYKNKCPRIVSIHKEKSWNNDEEYTDYALKTIK